MDDLADWKETFDAFASEVGAEILEIQWRGTAGSSPLRIVVDAPGGVKVEQCVNITRALNGWFDELIPSGRDFQIDVMSPGPKRKLVSAADYRRVIGKRLRLEEQDTQVVTEGTLTEVKEDSVELETDSGSTTIELSTIELAAILYEVTPSESPQKRNRRKNAKRRGP